MILNCFQYFRQLNTVRGVINILRNLLPRSKRNNVKVGKTLVRGKSIYVYDSEIALMVPRVKTGRKTKYYASPVIAGKN